MSNIFLICEGNSEKTIVNILLDNDLLVFSRDEVNTKDVLPTRYKKAKYFQEKYLTMNYDSKIDIYVFQDNGKEIFALNQIKKPYVNKINKVIVIRTIPELEMLMIHTDIRLYQEFQKQNKCNPSKFLQMKWGIKESKIKSKDFIIDFFNKNSIVDALYSYHQKTANKQDSLYNLLK